MLFMENTFLPLVLIFSADSAEWPADETLPRHKQHETHHKMNHVNTSEQFFLITQHAWVPVMSVTSKNQPMTFLYNQWSQWIFFFPVGKPSGDFGGWGFAGGKTILQTHRPALTSL